MPQAGLLLQLDGSHHDWLAGRGPWLTLLSAIDDATGRMVAATFRDEEDTAGYLELLREAVRDHGIPGGIYRDGHGAFEPTRPRAGQSAEERRTATHVGAALAALGIRSIAAGSPQAKGRIERSFGTDQDRLVVLLRLAGATDRSSANRVLADYLVDRNARFAVPPADPTPAWRPVPRGIDLDEVFSFRFRRRVANDHTVRIGGLVLDLPALRGRRGYAGRSVDVQVRLDGRIVVKDRGEALLVTAPILDADRLRSLETAPARLRGPELAALASNRPGYPPRQAHPWRRIDPRSKLGQTMQERRLTESLSR
jgi:hypothetical protein